MDEIALRKELRRKKLDNYYHKRGLQVVDDELAERNRQIDLWGAIYVVLFLVIIVALVGYFGFYYNTVSECANVLQGYNVTYESAKDICQLALFG